MTLQSYFLKKWLLASLFFMTPCVLVDTLYTLKKVETMNYQNEASWITRAHTLKNGGHFHAYDKSVRPLIITWQRTTPVTQEFADTMKAVWDSALPAYLQVEMDFLKQYPDVVGKEPYFKSFEPLFERGIETVDWQKVEEHMQTVLKSHFIFDPSSFNDQIKDKFGKDLVYVVTAHDERTGKLLGFITFLIRTSYTNGDVKVMSFAVDPDEQGKGIGKLLMSSIFSIVPEITRIFLCTRVTNELALNAYRSWGFMTDANPVLDHDFNRAHWTFLNYKKSQNDILQKVSSGLVAQES